MFTNDEDAQMQLALQLSKKQAEEDEKRRLGIVDFDSKNDHDGPKVHDIEVQVETIGSHLQKGFKHLKDSQLFSDLDLEIGNEKVHVHKIVLCAWSETFKVMLENDTWKESQQKALKINIDEKEYEVFKLLLNYIYTGEVQVSSENVITLLSLANYYAVLSLKESCGQILAEQLNEDNVFYLLDLCEKYSVSNLRTACAEYLAENFGQLLKADKLMELEPETWAEMLKSDDISIQSEEDAFNAVMRYANQWKDNQEKRDKALTTILPCIRYPFLAPKFLVEKVENEPTLAHLPILHKLMHETYRWKTFPTSVTTFRTKPRKGNSFFDPANVPTSIKVSDDRLTATNQNVSMQWQTTRVFPSLTSGNRYREFKINSMSMNGFFIGIATASVLSTSAATFYPGQFGNSWSYEATGGHLYYNGTNTYYGGPYTSGDKIGVNVDFEKATLTFYKNGSSLGNVTQFNMRGFDPVKDELFACVTFYNPGDSVTILTASAPVPNNDGDDDEDVKERGQKRQKMVAKPVRKGKKI